MSIRSIGPAPPWETKLAPGPGHRSPQTALAFASTTRRHLPPPRPPQTPRLGVGASIGPPLVSNMNRRRALWGCHETVLCAGTVRVSNLPEGALRHIPTHPTGPQLMGPDEPFDAGLSRQIGPTLARDHCLLSPDMATGCPSLPASADSAVEPPSSRQAGEPANCGGPNEEGPGRYEPPQQWSPGLLQMSRGFRSIRFRWAR